MVLGRLHLLSDPQIGHTQIHKEVQELQRGLGLLSPCMVPAASFRWEGDLLFPILSLILRNIIDWRDVSTMLGCGADLLWVS